MRRIIRLGLVTAAAATLAPIAQAEIRIDLRPPTSERSAGEAAFEVIGAGGYQLGRSRLRAWLVPEPQWACAPPGPLSGRIEIGGRLLLIQHDDATISAVNPDRALASGNIAWITQLKSVPDWWHIDERSGLLLVGEPGAAIRLADGKQLEVGRTERASRTGSQELDHEGKRLVRSGWAQAEFAISADGRKVTVTPTDDRTLGQTIDLPIVAESLLLALDERWLFAFDKPNGFVMAIDVASRRLSRILQINAGIGSAAFSENYLYLREARAPYASLLRLASLDEALEHVIRIPVGIAPSHGGMARLGGDGMAFLSPDERIAYLYMESGMSDNHGTMRSPTEMLAPYAAVPLRGARPVALLAHETGLRMNGAGRYSVQFSVPSGGRWRLVARAAEYDETSCVDFVVSGMQPSVAAKRLTLALAINEPRALVLKDSDGKVATNGPDRFDLLAVVPGSNWQTIVSAVHLENGRYRLSASLPAKGLITLFPLTTGPIAGSITWSDR